MLAKISSENLKAVGAKDASDFDASLTKFIAEAKLMSENTITFESLAESIKGLEAKIISEERIKTLVVEGSGTAAASAVSAWAVSDSGKKIIGGEASRITMEALANVGTTPAKPSPAPSAPPVVETKSFAEIVQANVAGGKTKTAAIQSAIETNPKEYQAYLKTGGQL